MSEEEKPAAEAPKEEEDKAKEEESTATFEPVVSRGYTSCHLPLRHGDMGTSRQTRGRAFTRQFQCNGERRKRLGYGGAGRRYSRLHEENDPPSGADGCQQCYPKRGNQYLCTQELKTPTQMQDWNAPTVAEGFGRACATRQLQLSCRCASV